MVFTKEQMKQYRIKNKDKIAKQRAEYYQENKEDIQKKSNDSEKQQETRSLYRAKKFECECGKTIINSSRGPHRKICKMREMIELRKSYHTDVVEGKERLGNPDNGTGRLGNPDNGTGLTGVKVIIKRKRLGNPDNGTGGTTEQG